MKKLIILAVVSFALIAMSSCAGSQRHCAAYAKHDTGNQPAYHDTQ